MSSAEKHILDYIFRENQFCSRYLIERCFSGPLDQQLSESAPIPQEFWERFTYQRDVEKLQNTSPFLALEIIEKNSPILLNRDLASIALIRNGKNDQERSDRIAGMVSFDEEHPEKYFEAAFALAHWRNWNQTASRWLHWDTFFDLVDLSLKDPRYATWGAYAFIWALAQNGGELSLQDSDYTELLWHFKDLLNKGLLSDDADLQVACSISLGKLRDWQQTATFSDLLNQKLRNLAP